LGNKGRWELLRAIYERYRKAGRKEKKVILSEFCANAGYNRKHAIRLLNGPRPRQWKSEPRRGRGVSYNQEVVTLLTAVWEAAGFPWSVRLKVLLPLRISKLANRRQSPRAQQQGEAKTSQRGTGRKGCGKDARPASLGIASRFPLSHSHNNKHSVTSQMSRRPFVELYSQMS